jgi:hypothetical protein
MIKKDDISKIVYWIFNEEVDLNDPEETIDQINKKLKNKSQIK